MLKYRLILGTLMTIFLGGIVILDGWLDGSINGQPHGIQATIFAILVAILVIPAQFEFKTLAKRTGSEVFGLVTIPATIIIACSAYISQLIHIDRYAVAVFAFAFAVAAIFFVQARLFGTKGVIANCGASIFSLAYLGILSSFIVLIRVEKGAWAVLMVIFVVKCSDIGAYAIGKLFGKHKFSPRISPGKTWEGMGGAVGLAMIIGSLFAYFSGIMATAAGAIFGLIFAFIGQLGDLAESMLKRDAEQKDSSSTVPGFGGILDVIDSPLIAAPFAYAFLLIVSKLGQ